MRRVTLPALLLIAATSAASANCELEDAATRARLNVLGQVLAHAADRPTDLNAADLSAPLRDAATDLAARTTDYEAARRAAEPAMALCAAGDIEDYDRAQLTQMETLRLTSAALFPVAVAYVTAYDAEH